jgi:hypothetical protein
MGLRTRRRRRRRRSKSRRRRRKRGSRRRKRRRGRRRGRRRMRMRRRRRRRRRRRKRRKRRRRRRRGRRRRGPRVTCKGGRLTSAQQTSPSLAGPASSSSTFLRLLGPRTRGSHAVPLQSYSSCVQAVFPPLPFDHVANCPKASGILLRGGDHQEQSSVAYR